MLYCAQHKMFEKGEADVSFAHTLQVDGVEYGMITGDGRLVLIKVGLGGNCYGYENRYLHMAAYLRDRYGCSVIVASNPHDGRSHVQADLQAIAQLALQCGIKPSRLLFFGHSNGGVKGLALAESGVCFEKMMLVNLPLMIDLHKTKRALSAMPKTDVMAVYGERDPSYPYVPFVNGKFCNLHVQLVAGADHNFQGQTKEFIHLSDWLFT